jgi:16S rRNA (guanine966-N2)-methyltransferase
MVRDALAAAQPQRAERAAHPRHRIGELAVRPRPIALAQRDRVEPTTGQGGRQYPDGQVVLAICHADMVAGGPREQQYRAVRIVAGSLGGRVLRAPHGAATRPTSEKVRQALFNILGPPPDDTHVLDLFAGSGALGLEALSRGAASVTFVERGRPAIAALRKNVEALDVAAQVTVVTSDVERFLAAPPAGPTWRWVFLDPPYAAGVFESVLSVLPRARLSADADVIVEHAHRAPPPDRVGFLLRTDLRRYGDTELSRYQIRETP